MKRSFLLLALIFSVVVTSAPVLADDGFYMVAVGGGLGTKITSLPYDINASGFYCLSANLTSSGGGITVYVDDVTIDLMGFRLRGNTSNYGINLNGRKNVEIRNGSVIGWGTGIHFGKS